MSYILEALKKIDQKREQKDQTKSLTFLGTVVPESKKRPRWVYPVIAALLLNAGVMIWWIGPWRSDKKETPAKPPAVLQPRARLPKEADSGEPRSAGASKEVPQSRGLLGSPGPVVEKEVRNNASSLGGKAGEADRVSEKLPAYKKGAPEYDSNRITPSRTKTASQKREGPGEKREGPGEKKVIYFKDGTRESCDDVYLTENFIHCTKKVGGSITNLKKIDLEKTFSKENR